MLKNGKKVIELSKAKKPKPMIATLNELMDDLENDRVTDFIVISRVKADIEPDEDLDGHYVKYNWMGRESSIMALGLLDYMKQKVRDFIFNRD